MSRDSKTHISVTTRIEGTKELLKELEQLGGNVKKASYQIMGSGAKVIRTEAEALAQSAAPTSGKVLSVELHRKRGGIEAKIKIKSEKWYYKFFESGATAHEIKGVPLVFEGDEGRVVIGSVDHPGQAASPFLRPAFDGKQQEALDRISEKLKELVEKQRMIAEESDD